MADSIRNNVASEVPQATIAPLDTINSPNFTIYWSPVADEYNHPDYWQLDELQDYSFQTDDLESGTGLWTLDGFQLSTSRYHSATHSLYSGRDNNISNIAQTKYPYYVQSGDQLRFWCWYDLEDDYDVAVVEASENNREWFQLGERLTRSSSWVQKSYPLSQWVGKWIYFRFRCMTDDNTLNEGFYVDDIELVPDFGSVTTLSSSIPDTSYQITNATNGRYYYQVRGHNNRGWGRYSQIEDCEVLLGVAEETLPIRFSYQILSNPAKEFSIRFSIPATSYANVRITDVLGRKIEDKAIKTSGLYRPSRLPAGIYFLEIDYQKQIYREKIVVVP
ncbi:MAG TPA: T9SS type A sorting domain-containing protein [bacterium (Candidatus Stahlbacteria)]|nr:T9SS type A sorting domain-containing protein [Candidatus Stahlbacteria bacterium]